MCVGFFFLITHDPLADSPTFIPASMSDPIGSVFDFKGFLKALMWKQSACD